MAALAACAAAGLITTGAAGADTFTNTGCSLWTVPNGVSSLAIDANGAPGSPGTSGRAGGPGDEVLGTVAITHGQRLDVCVGVGGGGGGSGNNPGGAGGGASGVSLGTSFSDPLIVAGGGGGSGGGTLGGAGGQAGAAGSAGAAAGGAAGTSSGPGGNGSSFGPSGPGGGGAGSSGSGAGGGGGAGYNGGGGGGASSTGGGGGGGGASYCDASSCTTQATSGASQVTITYTVASPPSLSIGAPVSGTTYPLGAVVDSSFSCAEGANGPGITSCADQGGQGSGARIDTSTVGQHALTVTATSADGLSSSSTVNYTVAAPPVVWLPLPASGAAFTLGEAVDSYFLCADGSGGPGLASCVGQDGGVSGAPINTSTLGTHTFTLTATSKDGQTKSITSSYTVVPLPTISHVQTHRGGVVTLEVTVAAPGAVEVLETAGLRSFAVRAAAAHAAHAASASPLEPKDALQPALGSFVFGRANVVARRAGTLRVTVKLSPLGRLLLSEHRTASLRAVVGYTLTKSPTQVVKAMALRVKR